MKPVLKKSLRKFCVTAETCVVIIYKITLFCELLQMQPLPKTTCLPSKLQTLLRSPLNLDVS
jgi:hypothetical protein